MASSLPSQRQLLTSLLNSIIAIPVPQPSQGLRYEDPASNPPNPLRLVPPSHRHLLTTLHVLFPALLLPALDLLDRRLVTRLILHSARLGGQEEQPRPTGKEAERDTASAATNQEPLPPSAEAGAGAAVDEPYFYLVRTARSATNPRRQWHSSLDRGLGEAAATAGAGSAAHTYTVRLEAWNCTCAAFALAAFSAPRRPGGLGLLAAGEEGRGREGGEEEQEDMGMVAGGAEPSTAGWEFGGLSFDGLPRRSRGEGDNEGEGTHLGESEGEGGVPCCKHLLACLLAERWGGVLGRYVVERRAGKEEVASIVADV